MMAMQRRVNLRQKEGVKANMIMSQKVRTHIHLQERVENN